MLTVQAPPAHTHHHTHTYTLLQSSDTPPHSHAPLVRMQSCTCATTTCTTPLCAATTASGCRCGTRSSAPTGARGGRPRTARRQPNARVEAAQGFSNSCTLVLIMCHRFAGLGAREGCCACMSDARRTHMAAVCHDATDRPQLRLARARRVPPRARWQGAALPTLEREVGAPYGASWSFVGVKPFE